MEQQLQKLTQAILARGELLKQLEVQCAAIQTSVEEMKPKPVTPLAQASSSRSLATGELDNLMPARCSKMCSGDDTASQKSALMPDGAPGSPATAALLDVAITSPAPSLGAPRVCADTCIIAVHQLFGEMPPRDDVDHAVAEVTPCTDYALVNTHPYCILISVDAAKGSSWNPWHDQLMHQSSGGVVVVLQPWPPPTQEHLNWFNQFDERDQHQVTQTIVQIIDQSASASASRYDMAADDDNETPLIKRPRIKGKSLELEPSQPTVSTQAVGPASPQPTHRQTRALTAAQQATNHGDPSAVVTYERGNGYLLEKSPICSFLEPTIDASTCPDVPVGHVAKPMNICSSGGKNRLIEHCKTRKMVTSGANATSSIVNHDHNPGRNLHAVTICKNGVGSAVQNNQEAPFVELDVASSTMGEVNMSLKCNLDPSKFHINLDEFF